MGARKLKMSNKKKYETYFAVEFIILVFVVVFTFIQIFFKTEFIGPESQIVNIGSWFFGLTISAMIPGLVYKGGEGYNLVFNRFTKKEKAFMWFIIELIIGFLIISGLIWSSHFLFSNFYQYVHLFLIEWILIVYIWFSQRSDYKFPWFYTIVTNLILFAGGYFIYRFY